jgi:hypothetical protein
MMGIASIERDFLRAAYSADTARVIAALQKGANVDVVDPVTGMTALHMAVGTNNLPLTRILVEDWKATFGADAQGRWPTLVAAECRTSLAMGDYIVIAEARALNLL